MVDWLKESGNVRRDAAYIASLPTKAMRVSELARLVRVYGKAHAGCVEKAIREDWARREAGLQPLPLIEHENPRLAALSAVGGKGGVW